jgi:hypothetical protein
MFQGKKMSFYKKGFEDYDADLLKQEQEQLEYANKPFTFRLGVNQAKEIIMLDDTGFRYVEHSIYNPITKRSLAITCKDGLGGEECLLCKAGVRPVPILIATVKDLSGYVDNQGNKKGIGTRLLLKVKKSAAKRLNTIRQDEVDKKAAQLWEKQEQACKTKGCNSLDDVVKELKRRGNILKFARLRIARYNDKGENCGDDFKLIEYMRPENLRPEDVPFDYEKECAPVSNEKIIYDLKAFFGSNIPPELTTMLGAAPSTAGATPAQSFEAPAFVPDDLPF